MTRKRVSVEVGTGYELLLSAVIVADPSSRSRVALAAMLQRRAKTVAPDAGQAIRRIGREPFINLLGWAHAAVRRPSAEALLAALAAVDPTDLRLAALGYRRRVFRDATPADTIRAAARGDRDAIVEMRRTSHPDLRHWQASLRHLLAIDAAETRRELVDSLTSWWRSALRELEPELERTQAAAAHRARGLLADGGLRTAMDALVPGITLSREPVQSRVVLVPSTIARPRFAITDYESTLLIAFPADPAMPDADVERLARLADALGDPLRVRVLRELAQGPMSTSDLARRLDVPRTSLQHHLAVLTSAGLATLAVDDATAGLLELRRSALVDLARLSERVGNSN